MVIAQKYRNGMSWCRARALRGRIGEVAQGWDECQVTGGTPGGANLVKVELDVVYVLDPNRYPNEVGLDTRRELLGFRQLLMRRRRRVDHQRLCVADVGKVRGQLTRVDKPFARSPATLNSEPQH